MNFVRGKKLVGKISKKVIRKWDLYDYENKYIYIVEGLYKRISKHFDEYISLDSVEHTLKNLYNIINNPDFVYFNTKQCSIEFYKKLYENVSVIIKESKDGYLYIASVYPVTVTKIMNRKKRYEKKLVK